MLNASRRLTPLLLALTTLFAASVECAAGAPLSVRDDLGRTHIFAQPPARIVSLSPGLTEALFALGLDDAVVGVSDFCNYPPAALTKPKVGGVIPNVEAIVALTPDLVVTTGGVAMRDFARRMDHLGIPVLGFDADSIDAVFRRIILLGNITGHEARAAAVVEGLNTRLETTRAGLAPGPHPRVLYLVNEEPYITAGPKSFLYDVILKAGGTPFDAGPNESYPRIGLEAIVRFDPEVIFFADDSTLVADTHRNRWKRWDRISAVHHGRLYGIPRDLVNRPGPRIVDAVEYIANALHGHQERPGPDR